MIYYCSWQNKKRRKHLKSEIRTTEFHRLFEKDRAWTIYAKPCRSLSWSSPGILFISCRIWIYKLKFINLCCSLLGLFLHTCDTKFSRLRFNRESPLRNPPPPLLPSSPLRPYTLIIGGRSDFWKTTDGGLFVAIIPFSKRFFHSQYHSVYCFSAWSCIQVLIGDYKESVKL